MKQIVGVPVALALWMVVAAAPLMAAPDVAIVSATATVYPQIPLWDDAEPVGLLPIIEPKAGFELVVVQLEVAVTWAGGDTTPVAIAAEKISLQKDDKAGPNPMGLLAPAGMLVARMGEASFRAKRRGQTAVEVAQPETRRLYHGMAFTVEKGLRKATLQLGGLTQELKIAESMEALSPATAIGVTVTKVERIDGPLTGRDTGSRNATLAVRPVVGKILLVTVAVTPKEANLLSEGRRFTSVEFRQFALRTDTSVIATSGSLRAGTTNTQAPTTSGVNLMYNHETKTWDSDRSTMTLCFVVPPDQKTFALTYRGHVVANVDTAAK